MNPPTLPTLPPTPHADPLLFLLGETPETMSTEDLRKLIEDNRALIGSPQTLRKQLTSVKPSEGSLERTLGEIEL